MRPLEDAANQPVSPVSPASPVSPVSTVSAPESAPLSLAIPEPAAAMSPAVVSAIVPARNEEASIAQAVRSLAAQPQISEVIVVNDESTDATAAVLEQLSASEPKLRIIAGSPLPAGWIGKNHAAWEGAQRATGEWLLFTDADAVHLPGSTANALAEAERPAPRCSPIRQGRKCTRGGSAR